MLSFKAMFDFNTLCVMTSVFRNFQSKDQGIHGPFSNQFKVLVPMAPNIWKNLMASKHISSITEAFRVVVIFTSHITESARERVAVQGDASGGIVGFTHT